MISEQNLMKWESIKTWKQWKYYIQHLLQSNDAAVESAITKLYMCQEEDEKTTGQSKHINGVGFNKVDAYMMTELARKLLGGKHLSCSEMEFARASLKKYWKQLALMSKQNIKKQRRLLEQQKTEIEHCYMEQLQLDLGMV